MGLMEPSCSYRKMVMKQRHTQAADSWSHVPGTDGMTEKELKRIPDFGASQSGFRSTCCHLTAGRPWISYLPSLRKILMKLNYFNEAVYTKPDTWPTISLRKQ